MGKVEREGREKKKWGGGEERELSEKGGRFLCLGKKLNLSGGKARAQASIPRVKSNVG